MKEITIKLTEKEYDRYVKKGQSEYRIRMKKAIEDEEYLKWMFMLGEYYRGQRPSIKNEGTQSGGLTNRAMTLQNLLIHKPNNKKNKFEEIYRNENNSFHC